MADAEPVDPASVGWRFDERAARIWQDILGADILAQVFVQPGEPPVREDGRLRNPKEVLLDLGNGRQVVLWVSEWGGLETWNQTGPV